MKKLALMALAVAAVMLVAIPAMAVDLEMSGHYRARGWFESNTDLNDETGASDAAMDMRFRWQPVFKIHDNLSVTVRFDATDNRLWGSATESSTLDRTEADLKDTLPTEDVGVERAYVDAIFEPVSLRVGRMVGGVCGLKFCDSESDEDRIKIILNNIDPWYLDFTYAKRVEGDFRGTDLNADGDTNDPGEEVSDQDSDAYWLHPFYSAEGMTTGALLGFYNDKSHGGVAEPGGPYDSIYYLIDPYFKGAFGPIKVEAELQWFFGDWRDYTADGASDQDYDAYRWIIDLAADIGPATAGIGYAHADGQEATGDDYTIPGDGMGGADWEPLLILTHRTANATLGGLGNLNSGNASTAIKEFGMDIVYVYGSLSPTENLTLDAIVGYAQAAETDTPSTVAAGLSNVDDEYGWEADIGAKLQVMDNLTYEVRGGWLSAGDLYKLGDGGATVDDTYCIWNAMVVTF